MASLSLCMIVKNEEKHLERCLASVKDVVDEIVIVDTGSDDKTLEIADSFNANIHHFKWNNDFSSARNFALSKCQSDWILYLDADEELNSNSVNELITIIKGKLIAVNCVVKSLTSSDTKFGVMKYPRLFPNDKRIKFEGKVHEQIQTSLNNNNIPLVDSSIEIIHYGYVLDEETANKKLERNLALLKSSKKNNSYDLLKLAQTLHGLKRYDEAEQNFKKIINDRSTDAKIKSVALLHYAILLFENNDFAKSLEIALKGWNNNPNNAYLNFLISVIYLKLDDKTKSFHFIKSALELNKKLLENNEVSESEIISDQSDLYFRAIYLAKNLNETEKLLVLINGFSELAVLKNSVDKELFAQSLLSFINEANLNEQQINLIVSTINNSNLISFIELLKANCNDETKKQILVFLNNKFKNSTAVKKNLASLYLNTNIEEAEKLFLECNKIEEDSAVYINLISLYIGKKDYEKVRLTFNKLKSGFSDKPIIKQKIDILSQKLNPILIAG